MTTYNWDLIERLLHEVQNGEGSFAPRKYAEEEAADKATAGESIGNLDALKKDRCGLRGAVVQARVYRVTARGRGWQW